MRPRLLVFVKLPRPGLVKTRLAATLGPDLAARFYQAMADRVRQQTAPQGDYERAFFFAPPEAAGDVCAWLDGEVCLPQACGDLGVRMAAAFDWAFGQGAARVALIGTDVPDLAREHVASALGALDTHDAALGPSRDGGYYLIALRAPQPALFADMTWSTRGVLAETLSRARDRGLRLHRLPVLGDIDDAHDLREAWPALKAWLPAALAPAVEAALSGSAGGGR